MYGPGVRNGADLIDRYHLGGVIYAEPAAHLARALDRHGVATDLFETGTSPDQAAIDAAAAKTDAADVVVVATANANSAQLALANRMLASGKPVVVVATRNPYDIANLTSAPTYLATYSWTRPAMGAVARVLLGKVNPTGRLPVRIPTADDPDATLYPYGFGLGY